MIEQNLKSENDALEVVYDALECKTPKRVPTLCLGADWDFMERYYAEVGLSYEEFKQYKKDKIPMLCPLNIVVSIKLGVDLAWTINGGSFLWLDEHSEPAQMHGGRFKVATRVSTYEQPEGRTKRPIPHLWWMKEGLDNKESIKNYMNLKIQYSENEFRGTGKLIETCEKKYNLVTAAGITGPWENLHFGIGFGQISKLWRKDRDFLHEINNYYCDFALDGMNKLVNIAKPTVVMVGDDYGYNQGLQMSLQMWRELVKPTLAEHVKIVHDSGAKFIIHSCGNIEELFKDFIEIDIDAVESLKPFSNDLVGMKKKYGKDIALIGAIDDTNMLKYSTPGEVKASVTQSIKDLGPGGFIPGATNYLLDQPVENVHAMYEAIRNYKI
ncbi:MAG: hypothetical protein GY870_12070 [archaeon]|nr:hypothetical protein [archaeon]